MLAKPGAPGGARTRAAFAALNWSKTRSQNRRQQTAQAVPFEPESCAFEMVAIVPQVVWLTSQRASFGPSKGGGRGAASGEAAAVATATHRAAAAAERAIGGKKEMEAGC